MSPKNSIWQACFAGFLATASTSMIIYFTLSTHISGERIKVLIIAQGVEAVMQKKYPDSPAGCCFTLGSDPCDVHQVTKTNLKKFPSIVSLGTPDTLAIKSSPPRFVSSSFVGGGCYIIETSFYSNRIFTD